MLRCLITSESAAATVATPPSDAPVDATMAEASSQGGGEQMRRRSHTEGGWLQSFACIDPRSRWSNDMPEQSHYTNEHCMCTDTPSTDTSLTAALTVGGGGGVDAPGSVLGPRFGCAAEPRR